VHVKDPLDDDAPPPREIEPAHRRRSRPRPECPMLPISAATRRTFAGHHVLFNGGPGSSTVWLHMGAFGPKRVVTADDTHSPAAPYRIVDNEYSLLDASDLVFVDAPGTGFGHLRERTRKAFYGVDQDAHAFANFIVEFLSRHNRWNRRSTCSGRVMGPRAPRRSPTSSSTKIARPERHHSVVADLELRRQCRSAAVQSGVDLPYVLALPTYTATAWYHHKLPNSPPCSNLC